MLKYSNNQAQCLLDENNKSYLINLRSGPLNGRTSIFMWLFNKKAHCLTQDEIDKLNNKKVFKGSSKYFYIITIAGALCALTFGEKLGEIYLALNPTIYILLTIVSIIAGIMLDSIGRKKDQAKLQEVMGSIKYELNFKICFINEKDKFVYILKMILLALSAITMFFGFGIYFIFFKSNPLGLIPILLYSCFLSGTGVRLPERYTIEIFE